jgi:hypothetical protein
MFTAIADQLLTWLSGQLARNDASKHTTARPVRPVRVEDEDRPELVFCGTVECGGEGPVFGYGLSPEFDQGKFNLAVFLDPSIPHWVDPIPSPPGTTAYELEGPTRGGSWEQVRVTRTGDVFSCTCFQKHSCDHIRALRRLDLFTVFRAPYDLP